MKKRDRTFVSHFVAVFSHVIRINRMCCSCWNPEIKQNIYIILTAYIDKTPYESVLVVKFLPYIHMLGGARWRSD